MKQRIQGMVLGSILTILLLSTVTVLASTGTRNITVTFRNIRLMVNGQLFTPRDGAGNIVEPFSFEGTLYLPLRAVGDALGVPVSWDGSTSTVYIGDRFTEQSCTLIFMDSFPPTNIIFGPRHAGTGNGVHTFERVNEPITDTLGNTWTNGILLTHGGVSHRDWGTPAPIANDPDNATIIVEYQLDRQYSELNLTAVLAGLYWYGHHLRLGPVDVLFIGDGQLIHRASHLTPSLHHNLSLNVSGVDTLSIKIVAHNRQVASAVLLTNMILHPN